MRKMSGFVCDSCRIILWTHRSGPANAESAHLHFCSQKCLDEFTKTQYEPLPDVYCLKGQDEDNFDDHD